MNGTAVELRFQSEGCQPDPTIRIDPHDVLDSELTIVNREERNRTAKYQRKHVADINQGLHTHERLPELAELNLPIAIHYNQLLATKAWGIHTAPPILAFGIGDLTANLLRPHYDARLTYPVGAVHRLFYLEDEPITEVAYSVLVCYRRGETVSFAIYHDVRFEKEDGLLPEWISQDVRSGLLWWAACPPLVVHGKPVLAEADNPELLRFAQLDADVRHVLGFPSSKIEEEKAHFSSIWYTFCRQSEWRQTIERELCQPRYPQKLFPSIYHAALGVDGNGTVVLVHRKMTIPQLAQELKSLGVEQGVLLDTGGSPVIWTNWALSEGTVLACGADWRPRRGAMVFMQMRGRRYPENQKDGRAV